MNLHSIFLIKKEILNFSRIILVEMKNELYKELIKDLKKDYNSGYKINYLKRKYNKIYKKQKGINKLLNYKFIKVYKNIEKISCFYNEIIVNDNINKYDYLFNVSGYALDHNQKVAIIKDPNNLLIVAGAGSGKTLTIIGKIIYLLHKKIKPSEILCLSFTNMAAQSLKNKLKENNIEMDVLTFHKLGINILKSHGYKVSINTCLLENIIEKNLIYSEMKKFLKTNFITVDKYGDEITNDNILTKEMFIYTEEYKSYYNLFLSFINLFKSNNFNIKAFNTFIKKAPYKNRLILIYIRKIYKEYEDNLNFNNEIDFNDMVNKAIYLVNSKGIKNYKYIIIDEFQDTSLSKINLIKAIQKKTKAKIVAVGDDWQSIYRFSGCDINNFLKFKNYFSYSEEVIIKNTYRNSKELLKISSSFIMKNKNQIRKKLNSFKVNKKPVKIYYYENDYENKLFEVVNKIKGEKLVLGRNNKDIRKSMSILKGRKDIKIMTVHKSKGLEADNVILVGLDDSILGFPNKIIQNNILKYVLSDKDNYPYEEERRLFYVALTRTKNDVYLLVNKNNPSIFVKELLKDYSNYIKID